LAMFNFIISTAGMAYEVEELNSAIDAKLVMRALRGGGNSLIIMPFVLVGIYSIDHLHFRAEARRNNGWLPPKTISHFASRVFVGFCSVLALLMVVLLIIPPGPLLGFTREGMLQDIAGDSTVHGTVNAVEMISAVQYPKQPTGYTYFYGVFIFPVFDAVFMLWRAITKRESYALRFMGCFSSSLNFLEVFALVALANIKEFYDFSTYVVNKQGQAQQICEMIKEDLHTDQCPDFYSVDAEWRDGLWIVLIAAAAFLAGHIVLWLAESSDFKSDLLKPLNEDYESTGGLNKLGNRIPDPNFTEAAKRRAQQGRRREEEFPED